MHPSTTEETRTILFAVVIIVVVVVVSSSNNSSPSTGDETVTLCWMVPSCAIIIISRSSFYELHRYDDTVVGRLVTDVSQSGLL